MKPSLLIALILITVSCRSVPAAEPPQVQSTATAIPAVPTPQATPTDTPQPVPATPSETGATATAMPTETTAVPETESAGYALRFYGTGSGDIDRVKVSLDGPAGQSPSADVGATDLTLEWWMKAKQSENQSAACATGNDNWITGNIIFDRDVWGNGDYGDYGVSLAGGRIAFGVNNGQWGEGLCSVSIVSDEVWHHIAVVRRIDGWMALFVDGRLEAQANGPPGDISYRDGRPTDFANDPYLVLGAEKHDAGTEYPSYSGWLDEVRLSTVVRYPDSFPRPAAPFEPDDHTAALWHFDEGAGEVVLDFAHGGQNVGVLKIGGPGPGPQWVSSDIRWPEQIGQ